MDDLQISSKHVILRPLVETDAELLYNAVHESRLELGEWLDWCRTDYELTNALSWIRQSRTSSVWQVRQDFGIFSAENPSLLLGCVGLSNIDYEASSANLGYWIRTSQHGRRWAQEAAAAAAKYAHDTLSLKRVEIAIHPLNDRSASVARAIGGAEEGLRASRIVHRGVLVEALIYSLIRA